MHAIHNTHVITIRIRKVTTSKHDKHNTIHVLFANEYCMDFLFQDLGGFDNHGGRPGSSQETSLSQQQMSLRDIATQKLFPSAEARGSTTIITIAIAPVAMSSAAIVLSSVEVNR